MGKSLRDHAAKIKANTSGSILTPAQETMRREMLEEGTRVHSSILDAVTTPHDDAQRSVVSGGQPAKLSEVLDEVVGMPMDEEVHEEALMLIWEHGEGLVLNWQQWPIVTKLVEAGIISGRAGS